MDARRLGSLPQIAHTRSKAAKARGFQKEAKDGVGGVSENPRVRIAPWARDLCRRLTFGQLESLARAVQADSARRLTERAA